MQGKYLITTDSWFYAPDGKKYKSVWGDVQTFEDNLLQIKTNRNSTNWYLQVGSEENHAIIAGCQVHYAVRCDDKPNTKKVKDNSYDAANGLKEFERDTEIYIAE